MRAKEEEEKHSQEQLKVEGFGYALDKLLFVLQNKSSNDHRPSTDQWRDALLQAPPLRLLSMFFFFLH